MASFFDFNSIFWRALFAAANICMICRFIWVEKQVQALVKKTELYDATAYATAYSKHSSAQVASEEGKGNG